METSGRATTVQNNLCGTVIVVSIHPELSSEAGKGHTSVVDVRKTPSIIPGISTLESFPSGICCDLGKATASQC